MDEVDLPSEIIKLRDRMRDMEVWRTDLERDRAVEAERDNQLKTNFTRLEERLDKIDSHISRIVWLILAAIITILITNNLQINNAVDAAQRPEPPAAAHR